MFIDRRRHDRGGGREEWLGVVAARRAPGQTVQEVKAKRALCGLNPSPIQHLVVGPKHTHTQTSERENGELVTLFYIQAARRFLLGALLVPLCKVTCIFLFFEIKSYMHLDRRLKLNFVEGKAVAEQRRRSPEAARAGCREAGQAATCQTGTYERREITFLLWFLPL